MKSLAHAIDVAGKPVPASMGEAMQSLSVRTSHILLLAGCLRIWATLLAAKSEFPIVPYVYQSAAQAVSASRLANPKEPEAADAAIGAGALLHFGVPFMVLAFGADYVNIWKNQSRPGMTLAEAELESFGFTHADASAIALEAFGFPATVIAAAKSHERPPSELRGAEQAVAVGANLAENLGFDGETGRVKPELATTWLIRLGLKESDKDSLSAQIRDVLNLILP
jgi:HD-like signal output (HDOD) protein